MLGELKRKPNANKSYGNNLKTSVWSRFRNIRYFKIVSTILIKRNLCSVSKAFHLFSSWIQGSNVYVKNINDTVTEDMLRELFSQCGSVTSVKLMQNEKGISRGFGFVCFSTPEEASKAVKTFQCMFKIKLDNGYLKFQLV